MKRGGARVIWLTVAGAVMVVLGRHGLLNPERLGRGVANLAVFGRDLFPPDAEALPMLGAAMFETIEIAFAGTALGFVISLPLAFVANRNFFGKTAGFLARATVGALRTIPSILFGVVFVVAFGLGPSAGILAVALYTTGYLAKIYYEAFEGVDPEVVEAVRGTGANRLQIFRFAVLPESANVVLSQALFMFEYNIRASTILGFVGAGGIGYYMMGHLQMLEYRKLMTAILLTFGVVMAIDRISFWIRSRCGGFTAQRSE